MSESVPQTSAGTPPEEVIVRRGRARFLAGNHGLLLAFLGFVGTVPTLWVSWRPGYLQHREDLRYNLGLAGGLGLLSQFLYSLRKHHPRLRPLGNLKVWFDAHVAMGLLAPLVIVIHSRFDIHFINGGVAFFAMMLVVLGGFMGRFLLAKVNFDFVGERIRLKQLHRALESQVLQAEPELAPRIAQLLQGFMLEAFSPATVGEALRTLVRLEWQRRRLCREITEMGRPLPDGGDPALALEAPFLDGVLQPAQRLLVKRYLEAVVRLARYHAYRRLFAGWCMAHVPVVPLLLAAGLAHVLAVHMY